MLKVCDYCDEAKTNDRRKFTMRRPTARRDRAILLTLLDTGLRATELCSLLIGNVDLNTGKVNVLHGVRGGAKGGKGRTVFLGKTARRAVWRYLADRDDRDDPESPLFIGKFNRAFNKDALRQVINALGKKAGVDRNATHTAFDIPSALLIYAREEMFLRSRCFSVTARWIWSSVMHVWQKLTPSGCIVKPVLQTTGGCKSDHLQRWLLQD